MAMRLNNFLRKLEAEARKLEKTATSLKELTALLGNINDMPSDMMERVQQLEEVAQASEDNGEFVLDVVADFGDSWLTEFVIEALEENS